MKNNKLKSSPSIFMDIIPISLYKSLVEMKVIIQNNKARETISIHFPKEIIIVSIDTHDQIDIEEADTKNIVKLHQTKSWGEATILLGNVSDKHGGSLCVDSGWELYPLMSNELIMNFSISPYTRLVLRLIVPENCHVYCNKKYTFVEVKSLDSVKQYHFPEQADPSIGDNNPFRLKSYLDGYPLSRFVPFLIDDNATRKQTDINIQAYFREAFLFHIISIFTPILYGIPIIALWAYPSNGFDISKKIPIMIAIIPFYIGLWYKSNIMKSVPTVTNFLTFLYVFLYVLFVIFAVLFTLFHELSFYLYLFYILISIFIFSILAEFCVKPVQKSVFLKFIQKTLGLIFKPFQLLFQFS